MTELQKLEQYLRDKMIDHSMEHLITWHYVGRAGVKEGIFIERNQIIVYDKNGKRSWDAVCHQGSYGYSDGLIEVMGDPVVRESDGDRVAGWLTAQDVIDRLEGRA